MKKTIIVSIISLLVVFSTLFSYGTEIAAQEPYKDGVPVVSPVETLGKTDPNPNWSDSQIFVNAVGGTGFDYVSSITQPMEGGDFAVAGAWDYNGVFDAFVAQFNSTGDCNWARGLGGPDHVDNGISVIEASDGSYVVTGEIYLGSQGGGGGDLFIAKFKNNGAFEWGKTFGGDGWDRGLSVIEDHSGNLVVSGVTTSTNLGAVGWDVLIAKFYNNGAFAWAARLDGGGDEIGHSVIEAAYTNGDPNCEYVITGWTSSFGNNMDILLARFGENNGKPVLRWAKAYGGAGEDVGDTVFGGKMQVLPYFGPVCTEDLFVSGYTSSFGAGGKDAFIAKFDSAGTLQWANTLGGASDDWGTGIACMSPHLLCGWQLVITGATKSFGAGGEDVLLAAFDFNDGSFEWARTFGGPANEGGFSVKQALVETSTDYGPMSLPQGRLFMAGYTFDWGSGPEDALIATFDPYGYSSPLVNVIQPEVIPFTPSERDSTTITAPPISTGYKLTNNVIVYTITPTVSPISAGLVEYSDVGSLDEDVLFSFAIIADNHINTPQLSEVVDWIIAHKGSQDQDIRFVIDLGDISDEGYRCTRDPYDRVKPVLDRLNPDVPYIPVIGDHDVWFDYQGGEPTNSQDGRPEELFNDVFSDQYARLQTWAGGSWVKAPTPISAQPGGAPSNVENYFQNFAFDYEGYHFICLDFVSRNESYTKRVPPHGWPDLQQWVPNGQGTWDWFKNYLSTHADGNENIFVFDHYPLSYCDGLLSANGISFGIWQLIPPLPLAFNVTTDYRTIVDYIVSNRYEDNINMWFSGHLHIPLEEDINTNPSDNTGDLVLQTVTTASVSPNVPSYMEQLMDQNPYAPALRIVRVHELAKGKYNLTISSTTGGTVTAPGEGTFTYDEGTVVNLGAEPDEGYQFINWTGDVDTIANADDATTTITMNGNYSITANFKSGCFIATAAYDTPMAEEIQILREFRDEYLLTNPVGQAFVDFYYSVSPPVGEFITEHPSLKPIVRAGLVPAVAMSAVAVNTTPADKIAIAGLLVLVSVALAVWAKKRRGRGPEYT